MEKETYQIEVLCTNCKHRSNQRVEVGVEANHALRCDYCGCKTAQNQGKPKPFGEDM